jgi:thiol-disulfide isomerase/thioredoxin
LSGNKPRWRFGALANASGYHGEEKQYFYILKQICFSEPACSGGFLFEGSGCVAESRPFLAFEGPATVDRWALLRRLKSAGLVAGVMVLIGANVYLVVAQLRGTPPPARDDAPTSTSSTGKAPPAAYPTEPLPAGSPAPLLYAEGWLNGEPKQPGEEGAGLVVLDIWTHWCPVCRQTAPGLVRLQQQFADQDVAFVSLTDLDEAQVKAFVDEFKIPWPCGYGTSLRMFSRFGAYNPERSVANFTRGLEVTPTLYVFDAEGRVVWHDAQARPRHLKESAALLRDLEAELERLLSLG